MNIFLIVLIAWAVGDTCAVKIYQGTTFDSSATAGGEAASEQLVDATDLNVNDASVAEASNLVPAVSNGFASTVRGSNYGHGQGVSHGSISKIPVKVGSAYGSGHSYYGGQYIRGHHGAQGVAHGSQVVHKTGVTGSYGSIPSQVVHGGAAQGGSGYYGGSGLRIHSVKKVSTGVSIPIGNPHGSGAYSTGTYSTGTYPYSAYGNTGTYDNTGTFGNTGTYGKTGAVQGVASRFGQVVHKAAIPPPAAHVSPVLHNSGIAAGTPHGTQVVENTAVSTDTGSGQGTAAINPYGEAVYVGGHVLPGSEFITIPHLKQPVKYHQHIDSSGKIL